MKNSPQLQELIDRLEELADRGGAGVSGARTDAIDAVLGGAPRQTAVRSLRDHEAVRQFHLELSEGVIRDETAGRFLDVINRFLGAVLR